MRSQRDGCGCCRCDRGATLPAVSRVLCGHGRKGTVARRTIQNRALLIVRARFPLSQFSKTPASTRRLVVTSQPWVGWLAFNASSSLRIFPP